MIVLKRLSILLAIVSYAILWVIVIATGQFNSLVGLIMFLTVAIPIVGVVVVLISMWFIFELILPLWNWLHGKEWHGIN